MLRTASIVYIRVSLESFPAWSEKNRMETLQPNPVIFLADPLFVRIGRKNEELSVILLSLFGY
ncbi:hypothetical protein BEQ56_07220 [Anaerolineaceae bacterium oral taxon 439]|nr:hypothetical protein BEQ56_07220 [Anaerolineaceae bacterium oral taxon 439]